MLLDLFDVVSDAGMWFASVGILVECLGFYLGDTPYWAWNPVLVVTGYMAAVLGIACCIAVYPARKMYQSLKREARR